MENLAYPTGRFTPPTDYLLQRVETQIDIISALPEELEQLISELPAGWLEKSYRPGGWTGRQVVHHLADSHLNALIRCKLATTETWPTILPYRQSAWAEQADHQLEIEPSLSILKGLHRRWTELLRNLPESAWTEQGYVHPEYGRRQPLFEVVALYAWHGRHHLGHLQLLRAK